MDELISSHIKDLRELRQDHIKMGKLVLSAHSGDLYPFDLLAVATLNRSMCLLRGFCDLLEAENFVAAAPLVRLQLDNCLRFSAGWIVEDPHDFAMKILAGKHVRNLNDLGGRRMTDRYLVERLSQEDPRFLTLYEETSGYVHLSNKHMFNAMRLEGEDGKFNMKVTDRDAFVPTGLYAEAIHAFTAVTQKLFEFMYGWGYTKDKPQITRHFQGE